VRTSTAGPIRTAICFVKGIGGRMVESPIASTSGAPVRSGRRKRSACLLVPSCFPVASHVSQWASASGVAVAASTSNATAAASGALP
jgi:hypothetical protein